MFKITVEHRLTQQMELVLLPSDVKVRSHPGCPTHPERPKLDTTALKCSCEVYGITEFPLLIPVTKLLGSI